MRSLELSGELPHLIATQLELIKSQLVALPRGVLMREDHQRLPQGGGLRLSRLAAGKIDDYLVRCIRLLNHHLV